MEKKMLLIATLSGFILFAAVQLCFVKYANANPYPPSYLSEHIPVSPLAYPSITILSPTENNTLHNSNNLTIALHAELKSGTVVGPINDGLLHEEETVFTAHITDVYYKLDWQPNDTKVSSFDYSDPWHPKYLMYLTGIPDGNRTVTITAYGEGQYGACKYIPQKYPWDPNTDAVWCDFDSFTRYIFGFTVDTVSPQVSVLDLDDKAFSTPEIPLRFTVNETASKITYCLDGQENVAITGNTTLTGLSSGEHSLTVYATDDAGNEGSSETINFSIVPFPTTIVIVSVITVAVAGIGLLVYFKKRKH